MPGVFATAYDVATFAHAIITAAGQFSVLKLSPCSPVANRRLLAHRALWDGTLLPSPSQSGKHFPKTAFGHLGYAGTSPSGLIQSVSFRSLADKSHLAG